MEDAPSEEATKAVQSPVTGKLHWTEPGNDADDQPAVSETGGSSTQQATDIQKEEGPDQESSWSFRTFGEVLATYLGIPALLLYPVGLFVLALQLSWSKSIEFLTAWYAASLVPATVAAGQGVGVLLWPLVISLAISLAYAHFLVHRKHTEAPQKTPEVGKEEEPPEQEREEQPEQNRAIPYRARYWVFSYWPVLLAAVIVVLTFVVAIFFSIPFLTARATSMLFLVPALFISFFSGRKIAEDYEAYAQKKPVDRKRPEDTAPPGRFWLWRGVEERWIFKGLLLAYCGSVISAFATVGVLAGFSQEPNLPRAHIDLRDAEALDGLLLSHSDGYWHTIASREANEGENDGDVFRLIPEGDVEKITVLESTAVADLGLTETYSSETAWPGKDLAYSLEVTNAGPDEATNLVLTSTLADGVKLKSYFADQNSAECEEANPVTCKLELGRLAKGDSVTLEIVMQPTVVGSLSNTTAIKGREPDYNQQNNSSQQHVTVEEDSDPPTTEASPKLAPDDWNNDDVTISLYGDDASGSGVKEIIYSAVGAQEIEEERVDGDSAEVNITSEGETTLTYSARDYTGNLSNPADLLVKLDKTEPTIECEPIDDLWHKEDVSIECTAQDSGSGLNDETDASFSLSTSVDDEEETNDASTGSHQVCDVAGKCATANSISGIKIDKKAPEITITTPSDRTEYKLDEDIVADYTCIDDGSGVDVDACDGSVSNGSNINTHSVGSENFVVDAIDKAGNTNSEYYTYEVIYDFTGILPPVEEPPTLNAVKAGDAVLVGFGLSNNQGTDIFVEGYPRSEEVECDAQAPTNLIENGSLQYTARADNYIYAWNTDEVWAGTCRRLFLKLKDGTEHFADFEFE